MWDTVLGVYSTIVNRAVRAVLSSWSLVYWERQLQKKLCLLGLGVAAKALSPKQFCQGGGPDSVVRTQVSSVFDPTLLGLNLKMQEASFTLQEEMKK